MRDGEVLLRSGDLHHNVPVVYRGKLFDAYVLYIVPTSISSTGEIWT